MQTSSHPHDDGSSALSSALVYLRAHRGARVLIVHDTLPVRSTIAYGGRYDVKRITSLIQNSYDHIVMASNDERARLVYELRLKGMLLPEWKRVPEQEWHDTW